MCHEHYCPHHCFSTTSTTTHLHSTTTTTTTISLLYVLPPPHGLLYALPPLLSPYNHHHIGFHTALQPLPKHHYRPCLTSLPCYPSPAPRRSPATRLGAGNGWRSPEADKFQCGSNALGGETLEGGRAVLTRQPSSHKQDKHLAHSHTRGCLPTQLYPLR